MWGQRHSSSTGGLAGRERKWSGVELACGSQGEGPHLSSSESKDPENPSIITLGLATLKSVKDLFLHHCTHLCTYSWVN